MKEINEQTVRASIEIMPPSMLKTEAPFSGIFPVQNSVLQKIIGRIKKSGYDTAYPIIAWRRGNDRIVLDGHTRLQAALAAGLENVPVTLREFDDPVDALDYAVSQQIERRNLSPADMLRYVTEADKLFKAGRKKLAPDGANSEPPKGKSAAKLAEVMHVSPRKVERLRKIAKDGSEATKQALSKGEISINKAYDNTVAECAAKSQNDEIVSDLSREEQFKLAQRLRLKNIPDNLIAALEKEVKFEKSHYPFLHYTDKQIASIKELLLSRIDSVLNQLA
jgi:ParB-like chromosome segregation protein Spo0J